MNPESGSQNQEPTPRKSYTAPSLVIYGAVRDLTQSGSRGKSENGIYMVVRDVVHVIRLEDLAPSAASKKTSSASATIRSVLASTCSITVRNTARNGGRAGSSA